MGAATTYRLRVGDVVIGLNGPDASFAAALEAYFDRPCDAAEAHVHLDVHVFGEGETRPVPNSLLLDKQAGPDGFDMAHGLVTGRYDPASGRGELHVHDVLTRGLMTRIFEQILYQVFHSACRRAGYDACLVHSSGVVRDGAGFLFVGPSGAGKSTVAGLAADDGLAVVNDEMNLIRFAPDGPRLLASPFNGHFRRKRPAEAPLTAVLLLRHAPRHALEPVGPGEAAAAVGSQIAPPVGVDELADGDTPAAMLDTGARLAQATAVRRLLFTPDNGFWPLLATTFLSDPKGRHD